MRTRTAIRTAPRTLLLLVAAFALGCSGGDRSRPSGDGLRTVEGRVAAIDLTAMAVDGPGAVRVETEDGRTVEVLISACEGPCSVQANEVVLTLAVGDRVRVTGSERGDELVLHDDARHSIEVLRWTDSL